VRGGGSGLVLSMVSERIRRNSSAFWIILKAVMSFSCGAVKVMVKVLLEIAGAWECRRKKLDLLGRHEYKGKKPIKYMLRGSTYIKNSECFFGGKGGWVGALNHTFPRVSTNFRD
jgi:hypothetical protein